RVPPSRESISIPAKPTSIAPRASRERPVTKAAVKPTMPAPTSPPASPPIVPPPLVPAGTGRLFQRSRGGVGLSSPIEVAQVSAAAAARLADTSQLLRSERGAGSD